MGSHPEKASFPSNYLGCCPAKEVIIVGPFNGLPQRKADHATTEEEKLGELRARPSARSSSENHWPLG